MVFLRNKGLHNEYAKKKKKEAHLSCVQSLLGGDSDYVYMLMTVNTIKQGVAGWGIGGGGGVEERGVVWRRVPS